jgi:hypothetical protein
MNQDFVDSNPPVVAGVTPTPLQESGVCDPKYIQSMILRKKPGAPEGAPDEQVW